MYESALTGNVPLASLAMLVAAAFAFAAGGIVVKRTPPIDPVVQNGIASIVGAVLLTGLSIVFGEDLAMPAAARDLDRVRLSRRAGNGPDVRHPAVSPPPLARVARGVPVRPRADRRDRPRGRPAQRAHRAGRHRRGPPSSSPGSGSGRSDRRHEGRVGRSAEDPLLSFEHGPAPHADHAGRRSAASAGALGALEGGREADRSAPVADAPRAPPRPSPTSAPSKTLLLETVASHYPQADLEPVGAAFDLAVEAHAGQMRATGEPYVTHPIASAQITAELGIDPVAIQAALLHDVPEDTEYSLQDLEERFGAEVAHMVDGVTKLSKFSTHSHEQQQAENIRKMLLAMAEDIRVVLIKLADRLHNMRTLYALPSDKQQRIARQTMEIYAPLAERLGIWQIKWELEDLAFKVLEPERFRELAKLLDTRRKGREGYIERAIAELEPRLRDAGIEADLQGRPKHIYSIYKKMQRKGAEFGEIYDVYAIRILVDDVRDCYAALGIVHALWRPIPGQFDDYIAVPKNNLYQSLHTAVIALDGKPLEIQIRTHAMHQVSEVGIAAHWRYKEGSKSDREYDAKLAWLRQLMDWQRDVSDATEFVEGIKLDIFQDQVFVFTPRGDIKDLPTGATPLDFAYRIHTDVGHRTIGAKVNNRLVPLDYRLKNGDIVEIVTTKGEHGPSRDWMNVVRTSHAREKIRQWFKRKDRDENIVHGRESLERELRRLARKSIQVVGHDKIAEVMKQYNMDSLDDFYAAIGYGAISAQQVVSAARRRRRRGGRPADRRPGDDPAADRRRPGQGRRRPARPVREVLPPDPGRPDRRVHHPRQGRHGPSPELPDRAQRARGAAADRGRVGVGAGPELPDRDPDRGLRPDRPAQRHHPGRRREQGQHRRGGRPREPGPHARSSPRRSRSRRCRSWPGSWAASKG